MTNVRSEAIPSDNPELRHNIGAYQASGVKLFSAFDQRVLAKTGRSALYFIGYEGDDADSPIKVGYSHNVRQRIGSYQTQSWRKVIAHEILYLVSHPNILQDREMDRARVDDNAPLVCSILQEVENTSVHISIIERTIHERFKRCGLHIRGEWFSGGLSRLVDEAKRTIREDLDHDYLTHRSMGRMLSNWKNEAGMR